MGKFIRWLFWNVVYVGRHQPGELGAYLDRRMRCRWPWKKFNPSVYHNDDGNEWHVYLSGERSYTRARQALKVDLHIGMETGQIVGFDVWDENLRIETEE